MSFSGFTDSKSNVKTKLTHSTYWCAANKILKKSLNFSSYAKRFIRLYKTPNLLKTQSCARQIVYRKLYISTATIGVRHMAIDLKCNSDNACRLDPAAQFLLVMDGLPAEYDMEAWSVHKHGTSDDCSRDCSRIPIHIRTIWYKP